jgi:hypothetical protein
MLTVDGATTNSPSGRIISLRLIEELTNDIKRLRNLCTSSQNCYITVTQLLIRDLSGTGNNPINDGSAIAVRVFTEDITPPRLSAWALDMNSGVMELYFSETVDVSIFRYDLFTLQGRAPTDMYSLNSSVSLSGPAADVIIQLSNDDLNGIKTFPEIGSSLNDTFLSVGDSAVVDMNGNRMAPISSSHAVIVTSLIPDFTRPVLVSFSLDIGSGVLTLTFSETVAAATFNFSAITLFNGQSSMVNGSLLNQPTASYRLTGGSWSPFPSAVIQVQLTQEDLSAINAMNNLGTSVDNTYITATSRSIFDTAYNPLVPIALTDYHQVSEVCRFCSTFGKSKLAYIY